MANLSPQSNFANRYTNDSILIPVMRMAFKDSGFQDDVVKTNAVQILKQAGIVDVRSL